MIIEPVDAHQRNLGRGPKTYLGQELPEPVLPIFLDEMGNNADRLLVEERYGLGSARQGCHRFQMRSSPVQVRAAAHANIGFHVSGEPLIQPGRHLHVPPSQRVPEHEVGGLVDDDPPVEPLPNEDPLPWESVSGESAVIGCGLAGDRKDGVGISVAVVNHALEVAHLFQLQ